MLGNYSIKIQYPSNKTQEFKEAITYSASIELYLHNIHTTHYKHYKHIHTTKYTTISGISEPQRIR